jgi:hypothetical protein
MPVTKTRVISAGIAESLPGFQHRTSGIKSSRATYMIVDMYICVCLNLLRPAVKLMFNEVNSLI